MTIVAKATSADRGGCCFNRRYICERVIIYEGDKGLSDSSAAGKWTAGQHRGVQNTLNRDGQNQRRYNWPSPAIKMCAKRGRTANVKIKERPRFPGMKTILNFSSAGVSSQNVALRTRPNHFISGSS